MKRTILCTLAISSFLLLSGCATQQANSPRETEQQPAQTQQTEQEERKEEPRFDISTQEGVQNLTQAIEEENKKISSIRLNLKGDYDFFGDKINSNVESIIVYDTGSQKPESYYIHGKGENAQHNNQTDVVFQAPNERYHRVNNSPWEPFPNAEPDRIDYHGFVEILMDILEDESYDIIENGNFYDIVVTAKNYDFVNKFHGQMNFTFQDVNEEEIDREITFQIDKNTLYLHTVKVILKYDAPSGKKLDVDAKIKMSEHNSADTSLIEKSLKEAREK